MSYSEADKCLAIAQRAANQNGDVVSVNLAAALSNMMLGLQADSQRLLVELRTLRQEIQELTRSR